MFDRNAILSAAGAEVLYPDLEQVMPAKDAGAPDRFPREIARMCLSIT